MTPITTIDICLGSSTRDAAARVLVTVTDEQSADRIVSALRGAALFQAEGLIAFARVVDRAPSATPAAADVSTTDDIATS
jgi:hypothetical protein